MQLRTIHKLTLMGLVTLAGCAGGGGRVDDGSCDPGDPQCSDGMVCEAVLDGEHRCATPVEIRGIVVDFADQTPIEGALIQAVDINGAAVGTSDASDETGAFILTVPAVRDAEGTPLEGIYMLRVQAAAYQEFPTAIRPALPLDAATATSTEDGWVIENTLTTVGLIALPGDTSLLGLISGSIVADSNAGILVVAESAGGAFTGFSDSNGDYTIFNVPAGTYTASGYSAGVQLHSATTSVEVGEAVVALDLDASEQPLSTVSGSVQIVNAPGGAQTSVVLAVESTFVDAAGRGTVPPGLRVGEVTGTFLLEDVPNGRYVVLAAFENDDLVRDPDQTIGGTQIVRIEVPDPVAGNAISLPEGFKVTEALEVVTPGADAPEEVFTTTPVLEWADDSSEDGYEIRVFDSFGSEVWSDEIGPTSGLATVTHTYAGPALDPGMFYQFRITSFRDKNDVRTAISTTEDLKGVFFYLVE